MRMYTFLFALVFFFIVVTSKAEASDGYKNLRSKRGGFWSPWQHMKSAFERVNDHTSRIDAIRQVAGRLLNGKGPKTLVFPGTKWCGRGHIAKDDDELGRLDKIDRCCRAHDKCPHVIHPGESKHNITNRSQQTLVSCRCDAAFQKCLKNTRRWYSYLTGHLTFNVIGFKCFKFQGVGKSRKAIIHQLPFRLSGSDTGQLGYLDGMIFALAKKRMDF